MSVLDNALQTLFKLSVDVKTLWENASPGSSFGAQNVSVNAAGCDEVQIICKGHKSQDTSAEGGVVQIGVPGGGAQLLTENSARISRRSFHWDENTVRIGDAETVQTYNSAASRTPYNDFMIPVEIIGIKYLGGGNPQD